MPQRRAEGPFTVATIFQQFCINFEKDVFTTNNQALSHVDCQLVSSPDSEASERNELKSDFEKEKDLMKFSTIIPLRVAKMPRSPR